MVAPVFRRVNLPSAQLFPFAPVKIAVVEFEGDTKGVFRMGVKRQPDVADDANAALGDGGAHFLDIRPVFDADVMRAVPRGEQPGARYEYLEDGPPDLDQPCLGLRIGDVDHEFGIVAPLEVGDACLEVLEHEVHVVEQAGPDRGHAGSPLRTSRANRIAASKHTKLRARRASASASLPHRPACQPSSRIAASQSV